MIAIYIESEKECKLSLVPRTWRLVVRPEELFHSQSPKGGQKIQIAMHNLVLRHPVFQLTSYTFLCERGYKRLINDITFPIFCRPHLYTAPVVAARTRPVAAGCIGSHDISSMIKIGIWNMFVPQLNFISMVKTEILSPYFVHVGFPQLNLNLLPSMSTSLWFCSSGCRRRRLRGRGLRRRLAPRRSLLILTLSPPSPKSSSTLPQKLSDSKIILFCRRLAFGSLSHNPYLGWYQLICKLLFW